MQGLPGWYSVSQWVLSQFQAAYNEAGPSDEDVARCLLKSYSLPANEVAIQSQVSKPSGPMKTLSLAALEKEVQGPAVACRDP